ncbi:CARDB domain-containing protein [Halobacteriaceae archaeon SHR40]|uniref:CARDB domain-containing protein n=1 Tax=Halovenus amylolytica TaxID=2500550 RepID=UPI000FE3AE48
MSDHVETLLETLATELSNREFESARGTVTELEGVYDDRRDAEEQRVAQSKSVYLNTEETSVGEAAELNALFRVDGSVQFTRGMLLTVATMVIEANEELAEENRLAETIDIAQAAVDELLEGESELEDQTTSTQDVLSESDIPPSVTIRLDSIDRSTFPVDEETTIRSVVENVGEDTAEGVNLSIDSSDGIEYESDGLTLGSLSASETAEVTIQLTGTEVGGQSIELTVDSENAGSDLATGRLTIREPVSPLADYTNDEDIVGTNGLRAAVADWQAGDIDTDLLREVVNAWQSGEQVN